MAYVAAAIKAPFPVPYWLRIFASWTSRPPQVFNQAAHQTLNQTLNQAGKQARQPFFMGSNAKVDTRL